MTLRNIGFGEIVAFIFTLGIIAMIFFAGDVIQDAINKRQEVSGRSTYSLTLQEQEDYDGEE